MMMMVRFHVSSMRVCYVGMVDGCGISSNSSRFRLYFEVRFGHSDEVELSFCLSVVIEHVDGGLDSMSICLGRMDVICFLYPPLL